MMNLKDLKRLSGLNESFDDDNGAYDPMEKLDKISSQLVGLADEITNHATNLDSEQEMNEVLEFFAKQLEEVAAKLRPTPAKATPKSERELEKSWGKGVDRMAGSFDDEEIIRQQQRGW
jgi:hypothetical protein